MEWVNQDPHKFFSLYIPGTFRKNSAPIYSSLRNNRKKSQKLSMSYTFSMLHQKAKRDKILNFRLCVLSRQNLNKLPITGKLIMYMHGD